MVSLHWHRVHIQYNELLAQCTIDLCALIWPQIHLRPSESITVFVGRSETQCHEVIWGLVLMQLSLVLQYSDVEFVHDISDDNIVGRFTSQDLRWNKQSIRPYVSRSIWNTKTIDGLNYDDELDSKGILAVDLEETNVCCLIKLCESSPSPHMFGLVYVSG